MINKAAKRLWLNDKQGSQETMAQRSTRQPGDYGSKINKAAKRLAQ